MDHKAHMKGRLYFHARKSFDNALAQSQQYSETHFRNDVAVKILDCFQEDEMAFSIPKTITPTQVKTYENTVKLLHVIAQFSIAGTIDIRLSKNGEQVQFDSIVPNSDKAAITAFTQGMALLREGQEEQAATAMCVVIEKYGRHPLAYERRGFVNYKLQKYTDALEDYNKSLSIYSENASALLGRAFVNWKMGKLAEAETDMAEAIKQSMPIQPIFWRGRRVKGELHLSMNQWKEAAFELQFVTKRTFAIDDPNYQWRKRAFFNYGRALLELGQYQESLDAFNAALKIEDGEGMPEMGEFFFYRGLAMKKTGQTDYEQEWHKAAAYGSAAALLQLQAIAQ